jgi:hypothetical protein
METNSVKGTQFKLNINMPAIEGYSLKTIEWEVKVFTDTSTKSITIQKKDAIEEDANNYVILVDSAECGAGRYFVTLTAHIPDADFPNGKRIERKTVFTGVTIDPR